MRILIAIIGNLCTGKSSLCDTLASIDRHFQVFAIDAYRRKYNTKNTKEGEQIAKENLITDILQAQYGILEMSGTSDTFKIITRSFEKGGGHVLTVKLHCDRALLLERYVQREESKEYEPVPFPWKIHAMDSIQTISNRLTKVNADLSFDTGETAYQEIAKAVFEKVETIKNPPKVIEVQPKQVAQFNAFEIPDLAELKKVVTKQGFNYDTALALFKKHQPEKVYLYNRFDNQRTRLHEKRLKRLLQGLIAQPHLLIKQGVTITKYNKAEATGEKLRIENITKLAEQKKGKAPTKSHIYPESLQEQIIKRASYINQKKILSNSLHTLYNEPEKAKKAVEGIIELRAKIDYIDDLQKYFERHEQLPIKEQRASEVPKNGDELEKEMARCRVRISKTRKNINEAEAQGKDNTDKYFAWKEKLGKEEAYYEKLKIELKTQTALT